ncbi:MAG: ROK family protein, partial [Gammaproteobacteria bacterium]|nr:ROK family protein [Gammaproteobacteria bacterium]
MKIGIDLGGTKIEGIALSDTGNALFRHRIPTPQGDYQGTLHSIAELISLI